MLVIQEEEDECDDSLYQGKSDQVSNNFKKKDGAKDISVGGMSNNNNIIADDTSRFCVQPQYIVSEKTSVMKSTTAGKVSVKGMPEESMIIGGGYGGAGIETTNRFLIEFANNYEQNPKKSLLMPDIQEFFMHRTNNDQLLQSINLPEPKDIKMLPAQYHSETGRRSRTDTNLRSGYTSEKVKESNYIESQRFVGNDYPHLNQGQI